MGYDKYVVAAKNDIDRYYAEGQDIIYAMFKIGAKYGFGELFVQRRWEMNEKLEDIMRAKAKKEASEEDPQE